MGLAILEYWIIFYGLFYVAGGFWRFAQVNFLDFPAKDKMGCLYGSEGFRFNS